MAKRTRYPNRTAKAAKRAQRGRPAGAEPRRPVDATTRPVDEAAIPVDLPDDEPIRASSSGLTEAELRRAEELEREAARREKEAIAEQLRRRNRGAEVEDRASAGDVNAPLSVRAAHEYAYVARDVKRIALTGGLMIAILAVLHVLINMLGVIQL
ncbi:MAG TPA: hypothetical protein VNL94_02285 [Candidatus Binatia bacterium]|nr:hypothetical protein [Candidatus Binatia bacterium]